MKPVYYLHLSCLIIILILIASSYELTGGPIGTLNLSSEKKNAISLLITLLLSSLSINLITASYIHLKKSLEYIMQLHVISEAIIIASMIYYYFILGRVLALLILLPLVLTFISHVIIYRETRGFKLLTLSVKEISLIAVLSALTAMLTSVVGSVFPSPTGGYTHIGDTVIFLAGLLFGSRIGFFTGAIGSSVADIIVGYPRWYVSVLAHGVEGLIAGFAKNKEVKYQVPILAISGTIMAFTYYVVNLYIKGYIPAFISLLRDLFGQAGVSLVISMVLYKNLEKIGFTEIIKP